MSVIKKIIGALLLCLCAVIVNIFFYVSIIIPYDMNTLNFTLLLSLYMVIFLSILVSLIFAGLSLLEVSE